MQAKQREEIAKQFFKGRFSKVWDSFMKFWYVIYMLVTFFSILFGVGYVLYYSYYCFSLFHLTVGIVVTLFMIHVNTRTPR